MSPVISVVVPFRDVAEHLDDCVASLVAQTHDALQIVLVDDGSTDDSTAIATAWAARDERITVLRQDAIGVGAARNAGIEAVTGEYLAFVDGDDLVPPGAFAALLAPLLVSAVPYALGRARRVDDAGVETPSATHDRLLTRTGTATPDEHPVLATDRFVWAKLYRRSAWQEWGLWFEPSMRYEDWPVALAATVRAGEVALVDDIVYRWRIRGSGTSITQASLDPGNMADRIVSAGLVVAQAAAADVAVELRREVHTMLARVDLVRLLQSFALADRRTAPALLATCRELVTMIDSPVLAGRPRLERLQHRLLRLGWWRVLREIAVVRAGRRGFAEYTDALSRLGSGRRWLVERAVGSGP